MKSWTTLEVRDDVVHFVGRWVEKTQISLCLVLGWIGISRGKFYAWKGRYGKPNEHNAHIPRDGWLEVWEVQAIKSFYLQPIIFVRF